MKRTLHLRPIRILLLCAAPHTVFAEQDVTNRLSLSARMGFNIKASFSSPGAAIPAAPRTTPDGGAYNYDDGYVLTDISGNMGDQTWYWGYDDSAAQVAGNSIIFSRTTASDNPGSSEMDASTPFLGAELVLNHPFKATGKRRHGLDLAVNYLPLHFEARSVFTASSTVTVDAYSFTAGTTPPTATPASPYQGTFAGPGFLIGATPFSSTATVAPGATLNTSSELDGTLWGSRIGPYADFPLGDTVALSLSGGLAMGLLDVDVAWRETGAATASGGGQDMEVLAGAYAAANLSWRIADDWGLTGGAQFEYLGDWEGSYGGRKVRLDLRQALFATLGIMYTF